MSAGIRTGGRTTTTGGGIDIPVSPQEGGTGVANGSNNTITFTGNFTLGITLTANTAVTFPTSGTLATTTDLGSYVLKAGDTMTGALVISPSALTGSSSTSTLSLTQTWNTSGTPTAIKLNVTDTASNGSSLLLDLQVGGASMFRVSKAGYAYAVGYSITAAASGYYSGDVVVGSTSNGSTLTISANSDAFITYTNVSIDNLYGNYLVNGQSYAATSGAQGFLSMGGTFAAGAGSATFRPINITYTINNSGAQSGVATGIFLNATETALNSMIHNLMDLQVGGSTKWKISNAGVPSTNGSAGVSGSGTVISSITVTNGIITAIVVA